MASQENYKLYGILNVSPVATEAEIHERHRALSLMFHPDRHPDESHKAVATQTFLEVQRAFEVLSDPFLRAVYDALGERGLSANWLEETRTRSIEQRDVIFKQFQRDSLQHDAESAISPRGRVVCNLDASGLLEGGDVSDTARGQQVRLLNFSVHHHVSKRISEKSTLGLAVRIARAGASGRGNFVGTLRHQYSPRLLLQASVNVLSPRKVTLKSQYESEHGRISLETSIRGGDLSQRPPVLVSVQRAFSRSSLGSLDIGFDSRYPQVTIGVHPIQRASPASAHENRALISWCYGLNLNSYDPTVFGELIASLADLCIQSRLRLEYGFFGPTWVFSAAWQSQAASISALMKLSDEGVGFTLDSSYHEQRLSIPIRLCHQYNEAVALWTAVIPVAACLCAYVLKSRTVRRLRELEIRRALEALEPDSPSRRHAEELISVFLSPKAQESARREQASGGLIVLEATYGALDCHDRDRGLSWDITIPLQTLVRRSQLYIPGRHPKSSIIGFLDPAPFATKSIRVRYLFRDRPHFTEVPEHLNLVLPLPDHAL